MKKLSIQRFSMLGLILMGVSAVTASVLPHNKSEVRRFDQLGSLTFSNDNCNQESCTPTSNVDAAYRCNVTMNSRTTGIFPPYSVTNCTTYND